MIPPPGWLPLPHRNSPSKGVRYPAHSGVGRTAGDRLCDCALHPQQIGDGAGRPRPGKTALETWSGQPSLQEIVFEPFVEPVGHTHRCDPKDLHHVFFTQEAERECCLAEAEQIPGIWIEEIR